MRPTISSRNKITYKALQSRKKKQSYSTSNPSPAEVDNPSTFEEEAETYLKPLVTLNL